MDGQVFAIKQVRIRKSPVTGETVIHAPAGSVLRLTGERLMANTRAEDGAYSNAPWVEVEYTNRWKRKFSGWTYEGWLERVAEPRPVDPINEVVPIPDEMRTPDPLDAQQYMVLGGKTVHNLCGEFCAAFAGGEGIDVFLDRAKTLSPAAWSAATKMDAGLGVSALEKLIKDVYGFETLRFADGLHDKYVGTLVSPGKMRQRISEGWMLIAGVKIDGSSGKLISRGRTGHWVVLTGVQPYGVNDGQVEIYNPFPNRMQTLSYKNFVASMGAWYGGALTGIWVPSDARFRVDEPTDATRAGSIAMAYAERKLEDVDIFLGKISTWVADNAIWIATQKSWIDEQKREMDL